MNVVEHVLHPCSPSRPDIGDIRTVPQDDLRHYESPACRDGVSNAIEDRVSDVSNPSDGVFACEDKRLIPRYVPADTSYRLGVGGLVVEDIFCCGD